MKHFIHSCFGFSGYNLIWKAVNKQNCFQLGLTYIVWAQGVSEFYNGFIIY